ncbi:MAG: phosphatase PAP2 family protein [Treponema sp.]|nr:phosphatase PAP2 family protein [Treponema sp.]
MRKYFILFCIITASVSCFAESPYSLDLTKDIVIGSVSLGLTVVSVFVTHSASIASCSDIPLSKDNVNAFDRNLMFEYSKSPDIASDIVLYGLMAMPLLSLIDNIRDGNVWATYGVMYAESVLLVFGTCEIIKNSTARYRPYCYFGDVPSGKSADYYKSFPSRHTAFAFMSAGFLASTFFTEYPDSPWKIPLGVVSYSLAAGVGLSRIFSGNHFITDVLAGAAIGSVYGYLIPWLHLRSKTDAVAFLPLYNGFMLVCQF